MARRPGIEVPGLFLVLGNALDNGRVCASGFFGYLADCDPCYGHAIVDSSCYLHGNFPDMDDDTIPYLHTESRACNAHSQPDDGNPFVHPKRLWP
ncbi:MAG: hypothetical protein ACP5Q1_06990, partial [Anaerolineae bacterium]